MNQGWIWEENLAVWEIWGKSLLSECPINIDSMAFLFTFHMHRTYSVFSVYNLLCFCISLPPLCTGCNSTHSEKSSSRVPTFAKPWAFLPGKAEMKVLAFPSPSNALSSVLLSVPRGRYELCVLLISYSQHLGQWQATRRCWVNVCCTKLMLGLLVWTLKWQHERNC